MNIKANLCLALLSALTLCVRAQKFAGGDLSQLPIYEAAGSVYTDGGGNTVSDFITFCAENGWNAIRLRLFVDPDNYTQADKDPNACQDLDMITALGKRVKDAGMSFMLDFHYSDTWADPSKQWTPKDWESLGDDDLATQLYDYTRETLEHLAASGAAPDFIQTGNEISYGMLWGAYGTTANRCYVNSDGASWVRFTSLLKSAGRACRDVLPDAKIIIHTERVAQPAVLTGFYDKMAAYDVDYDIIGLSYYPYYHGSLDALRTALDALATYGKDVMIVETGYPLYWAMADTTYDYSSVYPYTDAGQAAFTEDMITLLTGYDNVTGLFWWLPEYNPNGSNLTGWYNAPLIEPYTGQPTSAFYEIQDFLSGGEQSAAVSLPKADDVSRAYMYNVAGQRIASPAKGGIYITDGRKQLVK